MRTVTALACLAAIGCGASAVPPSTPEGWSGPMRVYTVAEGDHLSLIARRFGVPGGAEAIARRNGLSDPAVVRLGSGLLLPDLDLTSDLPEYRPPMPVPETPSECPAIDRWPAPAASPREGCIEAGCTARGAFDVCLCLGAADGDDGFVIAERGTERRRWGSVPFMDDPTAFEVMEIDLDGDGGAETVIASREGTSNGLPVSTWNVGVFESWDAPPLNFTIEEYGRGTFVARPDGPGCDVLATEWVWLHDAIRGDGSYLAGRRFRYKDGTLEAAGEPIVRRLLESFWVERDSFERGALWTDEPLRELTSPNAEGWPADPVVEAALEGTVQAGRILEVRVERHGEWVVAPVFRIAFDDGSEATLVHVSTVDLGADESNAWWRLGDAGTGAAFPIMYVPADAAGEWTGRRVRSEALGPRGYGGGENILWIEPAAVPFASAPGL